MSIRVTLTIDYDVAAVDEWLAGIYAGAEHGDPAPTALAFLRDTWLLELEHGHIGFDDLLGPHHAPRTTTIELDGDRVTLPPATTGP